MNIKRRENPGTDASLEELRDSIQSTWSELVEFGHEPNRIYLGIWEGPRTHLVQFLVCDRVVETIPLNIGSAAEFDELRQFVNAFASDRLTPDLPWDSPKRS